jgi:N4-gp56 family major capsid protein
MQTDFGALTEAQKRLWAAETWTQGRDESFWFSMGFIGKNDTDMTKPIHRITKLTETERGTECVMQLVLDMQGDGVVGNNTLEGSEEALVNDAQVIRIDHLRNGVKSKGKMAEQATVIRFRATAKNKLAFWLADKIDELCFLTIAGRSYTLNTNGTTRGASQLPQLSFAADVSAASTNRIMYAGSATSEGTLTANDKVDWNLIVGLKAFAERKKLKPIRDGGKNYYALVLSTEGLRDLQKDSTYQTIVRSAAERGSKNPLFQNAVAVVQGVVIHSHNKVFNTLGLGSGNRWGAGGTIHGAQHALLGAQALGLATIGNTDMAESSSTDYGDKPGIAIGRMMGVLKPQFKSTPDGGSREDFGVISLKTAAAAA